MRRSHDGAHGDDVRTDVERVSGPAGWHGEDFQLPFYRARPRL